jgi:hypothetical protein
MRGAPLKTFRASTPPPSCQTRCATIRSKNATHQKPHPQDIARLLGLPLRERLRVKGVDVTFWNVGDEEHSDPRFVRAGQGSFELYHKAGSWCMGQVRGRPEAEIPIEWFIPDEWVKGQRNGPRIAKGLIAQGMWERVDYGYRFGWIRDGNTTDYVRKRRKTDREKPSRRGGGRPDAR